MKCHALVEKKTKTTEYKGECAGCASSKEGEVQTWKVKDSKNAPRKKVRTK